MVKVEHIPLVISCSSRVDSSMFDRPSVFPREELCSITVLITSRAVIFNMSWQSSREIALSMTSQIFRHFHQLPNQANSFAY